MRVAWLGNTWFDRHWRAAAIAAGGLAIVGVALWLTPRPLADVVIRTYLRDRGVEAAVRTTRIASDHVVLDNVRIGRASSPDLIARRVTVDLGWHWLSPRLTAIRLDDAVLAVRVSRGGVSFGSLDRLIPPERSTRLPAITVVAPGARLLIATPAGDIAARANASGRLDRDFRASIWTLPATLSSGTCRATASPATFNLTTVATHFALSSEGSLSGVACATGTAAQTTWQVHVGGPVSLDRFAGDVALRAEDVSAGAIRLRGAALLKLTGSGTTAAFRGDWRAQTAAIVRGPDRIESLLGSGTANWRGGSNVELQGVVTANRVVASSLLTKFPTATRLPGIAARLVAQARAAAQRLDVRTRFDAVVGGRSMVRVTSAALTGVAGSRAQFAGNAQFDFASNQPSLDGALRLAGGGLPATVVVFDHLSTRSGSGTFALSPWRRGSEAVAASGQFAIDGDRIRATSQLQLSGGYGATVVEGLQFAAALATDRRTGTISVGPDCATASVRSLKTGALALGPATARFCPIGGKPLLIAAGGQLNGAGTLGALQLSGRWNGRPIAVQTQPVVLAVDTSGSALQFRVGALKLSAATAAWRCGATVSGALAQAAGGWSGNGAVIGATALGPRLAASAGAARWRLTGGRLTLAAGSTRLTDPARQPSFAPLRLTGIEAAIDADRVIGKAAVQLDTGGAKLAVVNGNYAFATASGTAHVTSSLLFDSHLQPAQISELARGLVANVAGTVSSDMTLRLAAGTAAGSGSVRFGNLALATAALGPVTGIGGTVRFDDVLALHTMPGQTLRLGTIDPGVLLSDGVVTFQLLGPDAVRIERIAWPFTGGTLTVQPVTIRTGVARRTFNVAVDGLDGEQFLQRFQIKNLNVTGVFDGRLPLVFDRGVGRIDGGVLTARAAGGVLQYVGDVGQASMGAAGRLAFDALRKLRYRKLTLRLDGELDGELVTGIDLSGINEVPIQPAGRLPLRAANIPFKFGITVRAPFRALLGTAASISDVRSVFHATTLPATPSTPPPAAPSTPIPKP